MRHQQETVGEIKEHMRRFGIDVDNLERSSDLMVIDYREWYIIDGRFDPNKSTKLWEESLDAAIARGRKALGVVGEAQCFFDNKMVKELVEYEKSSRMLPNRPMTTICAYDCGAFLEQGGPDLIFDLVAAHATVIFTGARTSLVKILTSW